MHCWPSGIENGDLIRLCGLVAGAVSGQLTDPSRICTGKRTRPLGFVPGHDLVSQLPRRRGSRRCSTLPPALRVGANRRCGDPCFALQAAGFRRAPVHIQGIENGDLIRDRQARFPALRRAAVSRLLPLEAKLRTKADSVNSSDSVNPGAGVPGKAREMGKSEAEKVTVGGGEVCRTRKPYTLNPKP